jgi:muramoyltetrapeptide carboxypeptidase
LYAILDTLVKLCRRNIMKRKKFILSAGALAASLLAKTQPALLPEEDNEENLFAKIPPYLKKGDVIGVTCPAGYLSWEDFEPARKKLEEWGFVVKAGSSVGTRSNTFAATDEERTKDLQQMLDDPQIKAIMCGRGGYGVNRIIDRLRFQSFLKKPKWLIGFSDITLLHTHLNTRFRTASIHSKMCNSFLKDEAKGEPLQLDSIASIEKCLKGNKMSYTSEPHEKNRSGQASGLLVGGNLSIICSAQGSPSALQTRGRILFLEEVGEYLYSLDRMLWNLKRSGLLSGLAGLIIGGFNRIKPDDPGEEFGETIYDIVTRVTEGTSYPVCFNFPVGHQKINYALKCGVRHHLSVTEKEVVLKEI